MTKYVNALGAVLAAAVILLLVIKKIRRSAVSEAGCENAEENTEKIRTCLYVAAVLLITAAGSYLRFFRLGAVP